jgi:hypothetical protein
VAIFLSHIRLPGKTIQSTGSLKPQIIVLHSYVVNPFPYSKKYLEDLTGYNEVINHKDHEEHEE